MVQRNVHTTQLTSLDSILANFQKLSDTFETIIVLQVWVTCVACWLYSISVYRFMVVLSSICYAIGGYLKYHNIEID